MRRRTLLLLAATMIVLVLALVVGCGGGGQPQQLQEEEEAAEQRERNPQPQQEKAKTREVPEYGDLRPGKYVTDEFDPALSFEVVDEGWVVGGAEERGILDMRQGVEGGRSRLSTSRRSSIRANHASWIMCPRLRT